MVKWIVMNRCVQIRQILFVYRAILVLQRSGGRSELWALHVHLGAVINSFVARSGCREQICLCCFSEASEQNKSETDEREVRMRRAKTHTLSCLFLQPISACVTIRSMSSSVIPSFLNIVCIFPAIYLLFFSLQSLCHSIFLFSFASITYFCVCCLKVSCSFETSGHYFSFLLRTLTFFSKFLFSLSSNQHAWVNSVFPPGQTQAVFKKLNKLNKLLPICFSQQCVLKTSLNQ